MRTLMVVGKVTNGRMTTYVASENKWVAHSRPVHSTDPIEPVSEVLNIPSFMQRPPVPVTPVKHTRTPNQERTFAWWLDQAMNGDN